MADEWNTAHALLQCALPGKAEALPRMSLKELHPYDKEKEGSFRLTHILHQGNHVPYVHGKEYLGPMYHKMPPDLLGRFFCKEAIDAALRQQTNKSSGASFAFVRKEGNTSSS